MAERLLRSLGDDRAVIVRLSGPLKKCYAEQHDLGGGGTDSLGNCLIVPVQRLTKRLVHGCENFVLALAYLLCLALPGSCLSRFTCLFVRLCSSIENGLTMSSDMRYGHTLYLWQSQAGLSANIVLTTSSVAHNDVACLQIFLQRAHKS